MNVSTLGAAVARLEAERVASDEATDTMWLLLTGCMVFFMQCGFGMLEAGSVRSRATQGILIKNLFDACIGGMVWWLIGYGFANGEGSAFVGFTAPAGAKRSYFATADLLSDDEASGDAWALVFFQFTFAAASTTIVSGAVAERAQLPAYAARARRPTRPTRLGLRRSGLCCCCPGIWSSRR